MKRILFVFSILTSLTLTSFADGKDGKSSKPVRKSIFNDLYTLIHNKPTEGILEVTIANEEGKALFIDQIIESSAFKKSYDFTNLPSGLYIVTIKDGDEIATELVEHQKGRNRGINSTNKVAITKLDGERFKVLVKDVSGEMVTVTFTDSFGRILYEDYIWEIEDFKRNYDLSQIGRNGVQINVSIKDTIYSQVI